MNQIINLMAKGLDGAAQRQTYISNNIANADTPGYKREDIDFQNTLRDAISQRTNLPLKSTRNNHIDTTNLSNSSKFSPFKESNTNFRIDGSNVDIEREMAEMAKNNIYFDTLAQQLNSKFNMLGSVLERSGG